MQGLVERKHETYSQKQLLFCASAANTKQVETYDQTRPAIA